MSRSVLAAVHTSICKLTIVTQTLLNPFHELNAPIRSPVFDARVRASAKKHL